MFVSIDYGINLLDATNWGIVFTFECNFNRIDWGIKKGNSFYFRIVKPKMSIFSR